MFASLISPPLSVSIIVIVYLGAFIVFLYLGVRTHVLKYTCVWIQWWLCTTKFDVSMTKDALIVAVGDYQIMYIYI